MNIFHITIKKLYTACYSAMDKADMQEMFVKPEWSLKWYAKKWVKKILCSQVH